MAGGAVIGALRVVLGADTAALEKGLKDAQSRLSQFSAGMAKHGAAIAAAFAAMGGALGYAVKQAVNEADKLGKLAQSIGIPVEELSRLKHAADLSGVSLEALGVSVGRLSKNMAEAAREPAGQMALAFKAVGVSVRNTDGTLKQSSQVITEIAGKFVTYKDGAEKTALAIALFGKSGAALIPMLNAGATGMREMMNEADELGIVIDSKTAKSAEAFNDNLTRLGKVKDSIILQITSRMLPAFENFSTQLVSAAKNSEGLKASADGLVFIMRSLTTVVIGAGTAMVTFSTAVAGIIAAVILAGQGQWTAALEALKMSWGDIVEQVKTGGDAIKATWEEVAIASKKGGAEVGKAAAPIVASASEISKAAAQAEAALKKIYAAGKKTFEGTRNPTEAFGVAVMKLNQQFEAGAISADTYARAVAKAQETMIKANPHAQNLGNALESAFDRAWEGTLSAREQLGLFLKDLLKMEAMTAFKMLLYGNAGTGGGSSGIFGAIFGQAPKFANGGNFTVGGSGGIDSQMVQFRATPGERVKVSKDGQAGDGAINVNFAPSYNVQGSGPEIAALRVQMAQDKSEFPRMAVAAVKEARSRRML